ncbi:thiamine-phosphate kinase [Ferrovum sp. PN-J185]|uniref:thiamine-phosphate kinase n=1 Tax=Ferrovum sp. PN-J185 TaxID=1356306 RepID=UPI000797E36A|nr:thiamine-phosphate kinase [Ferrovum sp. PN-J185]KXW56361.1 thiamine-monophosphate kinase [Ferrovum sp. PN-J185]MCC6069085.1 thiamine-phosphate kinase [Ferrovum sp. PN-J185]MDE1890935.1 thiamine-phosphate kinase [Betaproteobacteria bacterium]MDE2055753.1 thiamine-phosphate kinase [Betaproteobacteria bacterium]
MASEFDFIQRYCRRLNQHTDLGVGDDAALMKVRSGYQLAVSTDILVAGVHFFLDIDALFLGRKAAAVNLSDMAAMGATPRWVTLGLTLSDIDDTWLNAFSYGFYTALSEYDVDWVGGDTTRGPLNIAVTVMGEVPQGRALTRSGAQVGDEIWVSGTIGDAAWGLAYLNCDVELDPEAQQYCRYRLENPTPRVKLGEELLALAHSAIDISDGLLADLNHILVASQVGAVVDIKSIPLSQALLNHRNNPSLWDAVLSGGDDYELCFTAPQSHQESIIQLSEKLCLPLTCIGRVTANPQQRELLHLSTDKDEVSYWSGYDHFKEPL